MQLLNEQFGELFDDQIATVNHNYQQQRIRQLKEELRHAKQQERAAIRMVQQPILLHRYPTRHLD